MNQIFRILIVFVTFHFNTAAIKAQLSDNFPKEVQSLILSKPDDLKGKEIEKQNSATIYQPLLSLTGFDLKYVTSILGNSLSAVYLSKGTDSIMDNIYEKLNQIPFLIFDSKYKAGLIGKGFMDQSIARKIKVKSSDTGKDVLIVTLDKSAIIRLEFLNK
ncbi:hypothetical protein [Polluticaenibacter yanchengensis]|uniref:DUF4252 domain-containing protein n=1 Tax=Polluticaenibacter yanchengensis TaxID=3014562 RepID=A0ABT4UHE7_9BACT|nr:hypothetical protein [Chitinophagaceae bacterium LY-5]